MCGFVAVISPRAVPDSLLTTMRDRLYHRGPDDGRNSVINREGYSISLAQRRLSIQDLSDDAALPMQSDDGKITLAYNGEIYNFVELRKLLEAKGHRFRTHGDSEVLLNAYREWKEDCVNYLNGMFAFFIWDEDRQQAFIARDRFGEKPLFYTSGNRGLVAFASEIKALTAHPDIPCEPDLVQIQHAMQGRVIDGRPVTLFSGINRFLPAHAMKIDARGNILDYRRYWTPDYEQIDDGMTLSQARESFRSLLLDAVQIRTRADVGMAASLSGGLDSSTLVGILSRERPEKQFELRDTISASVPEDSQLDEIDFIRDVCRFNGIKGNTLYPGPEELLSDMKRLHWHHESILPSASMFMEWAVMKRSRELGYKIMMDGQGADELLGGYQYYYRYFQQDAFLRGDWRSLFKNTIPMIWRLRKYIDPARGHNEFFMIRDELEARGNSLLIDQSKYPEGEGLPSPVAGNCFRYTLAEGMLYDSLPIQLNSADRNSMAHGIETRLPFLDYRLVDFCITLPDDFYIRNGLQKYLLRYAARSYLPPSVRKRTYKIGYSAPQALWARGKLGEWIQDSLEASCLSAIPGFDPGKLKELQKQHNSKVNDYSDELWKWASLSEWMGLFDDGTWRGGMAWLPEHGTGTEVVNVNAPAVIHDVRSRRGYCLDWRFCSFLMENIKRFNPISKHSSVNSILLIGIKIIRRVILFAVKIIRRVILFPVRKFYSIRNVFRPPAYPPEECRATIFQPEKETGYKKTAWVFSFTGVSNEPRVLRQTRALVDDGWRVIVAGFDGHSSRPADWYYIRLPSRQPYSYAMELYLRGKRAFGLMLLKSGLPVIRSRGADLYFNNIPNWLHMRNEAVRLAREHPELRADLVVCHDYFTCYAGHSVKKVFNASFSLDCHEYSSGQYMHDPQWVKNTRPWVIEVQKYYLHRSDCVTTVCDGIAQLLKKENRLKRDITVVKSVPFRNIQHYRSVDPDRIIVLYHGDISYTRGIHKAIMSLRLWRPEFHLLIRGNGDATYISELQRIASEQGVADRFSIEPAVAFDEIIPLANKADIGYFVHKDYSAQKRFVLPNKFFEYIMAGLALCVSDLPEMAKIIRKYDLGLLVESYDEEAIAAAINSLDADAINCYKRASLVAAETLNWEHERAGLLQAYNKIYTDN